MLIVRTAADVRAALRDAHHAGRSVGLVATMGSLHAGHRSLIEAARADCDVVVASLFVNPRQFEDAADLDGYPRDERHDAALAEEAGVDVLYAPSAEAMYPPGFATTVSVAGPAEGLESAHRGPGHFDGVATVVCKLLIAVGPSRAYFGAKDAQQAAVVTRMARDLDLATEIVVRPTVREPDGLALSSRNARLGDGDRGRATVLHAALLGVAAAIADGERDPAAATAAARERLRAQGAAVDYLEIVDPTTMRPLRRIGGAALAVVAARIGAVRLIDNLSLSVPAAPPVATPTRAPTP